MYQKPPILAGYEPEAIYRLVMVVPLIETLVVFQELI